MKTFVVLGATSAIAEACARLWAQRGDALLLVARDMTRLEEVAADLRVRGRPESVTTYVMDLTDLARIPDLVARSRGLPAIDGVLIAHGFLPAQSACEVDPELTVKVVDVNGTSAVALLTAFAQVIEQRGREGVLAVIGSVAGDRGRASNYTYGAAKAMVDAFAAGLRHRLWRTRIRVLTIKPGFVDTPMTAGIAERGGPLWSTPAVVARDIVSAMDARTGTLYTPWFWRYIMWIIRALPESVFVRTRL